MFQPAFVPPGHLILLATQNRTAHFYGREPISAGPKKKITTKGTNHTVTAVLLQSQAGGEAGIPHTPAGTSSR